MSDARETNKQTPPTGVKVVETQIAVALRLVRQLDGALTPMYARQRLFDDEVRMYGTAMFFDVLGQGRRRRRRALRSTEGMRTEDAK